MIGAPRTGRGKPVFCIWREARSTNAKDVCEQRTWKTWNVETLARSLWQLRFCFPTFTLTPIKRATRRLDTGNAHNVSSFLIIIWRFMTSRCWYYFWNPFLLRFPCFCFGGCVFAWRNNPTHLLQIQITRFAAYIFILFGRVLFGHKKKQKKKRKRTYFEGGKQRCLESYHFRTLSTEGCKIVIIRQGRPVAGLESVVWVRHTVLRFFFICV